MQTLATQSPCALACTLQTRLQPFSGPLFVTPDEQIDRCLVRTFAATVQAIVQLRHRASGLLLSELGSVLLSPEHAPADTRALLGPEQQGGRENAPDELFEQARDPS